VDGYRRALSTRQVGRGGAGIDVRLVTLLGDRIDGERDRRGRDVEHHIHAVTVEPLAGDGGADVRLVLMVGIEDLDRKPVSVPELLRCLPGAGHRALAGIVAIGAGEVSQHADLDRLTFRPRPSRNRQRCGDSSRPEQGPAGQIHRLLSW